MLDGDIGVENASPEVIIEALKKAKCNIESSENIFTTDLLFEYELIGNEKSSDLRAELGNELGIGYSNGKQFISKLNRYGVSLEDFKKAYQKIKNK